MYAEGITEFLLDIPNWFDLAGYITIIGYSVLMVHEDRNKNKFGMNYHRDIFAFGIFCTNIRFLYHLSNLSTKVRTMLKIIVESFKNLITFLIFLYTLMFILTVCKYVTNYDEKMRFKDLGL